MRVCLNFWIKQGDRNFIGRGKVMLLKYIHATGSLSKAAKIMQMSYKAAWDDVQSINHVAPYIVVETNIGGKNGGGSRISAYGLKLIEAFDLLQEKIEELEKCLQNIEDLEELKQHTKMLEDMLDFIKTKDRK